MHLHTVYALVNKPTEDANVTQEVPSWGATLCSSCQCKMLYVPCVSQDNVTDHFTPAAAGII